MGARSSKDRVEKHEGISKVLTKSVGIHDSSYNWAMGVSFEDAKRRCVEGDLSLVGKATEIADRVSADALREVSRMGYQAHYSGSRVNVPAYLSGQARCMVRRVKRKRETRDVSIYVNLSLSAGVTSEQAMARGCTILGLIEALRAMQVHVELYLTEDCTYYHGEAFFMAMHIDSNPLDMSTAAFMLAHPAFVREVVFGYMKAVVGETWGQWTPSTDVGLARQLYDLSDEDVYVPGAHYHDELVTKPDEWIRKRLNQIVGASHV